MNDPPVKPIPRKERGSKRAGAFVVFPIDKLFEKLCQMSRWKTCRL